jgi:proteasome-associated ATPase
MPPFEIDMYGSSRRYDPYDGGRGPVTLNEEQLARLYVLSDYEVRDGRVDLQTLIWQHNSLLITAQQMFTYAKNGEKALAELQRLKDGALLVAEVIWCKNGKVMLSADGQSSVAKDPGGLKPGDQVAISSQTRQVVEKLNEQPLSGETTEVLEVLPDGAVMVRAPGEPRQVITAIPLQPGDRVVLDRSLRVVIAKNGSKGDKPKAVTSLVHWDDVGGLAAAKAELIEAVELPHLHRELYAKHGQKPIKGAMLWGPPGCGKTMLGKAVAGSLARTHKQENAEDAFIYVKGPELIEKWVGSSEGNVRELFERAKRHYKKHGYPSVIFIDEADAVLGARGGMSGGSWMSGTMVPAFLAEMDGMDESGAFVLLATNRPDTLDSAVVRDGRIDRRIRIDRPDKETAAEIFKIHLQGRLLRANPKDLARVGVQALFAPEKIVTTYGNGKALTLGDLASGAMIAGIVSRAASIALRADVEAKRTASKAKGIMLEHMYTAAAQALAEQKGLNQSDACADLEAERQWKKPQAIAG